MNRRQRRGAARRRRPAAERDAALRRAKALHEAGRFAEAADLYVRHLDDDADRARVLAMIGADALARGDAGTGAALLARAVDAAPKEAAHHAALGEVLEAAGRTEDAARAWGRASDLEPGDVVAAVNASILARRLGRAEAAAGRAERAVAAAPEDARAHAALGAALLEARRPEDALAPLRRAVALDGGLDGTDGAARLTLARALLALEHGAEAEEHCRRALAGAPDDGAALASLAQALRQQGRLTEAIETCRAAVRADPDDAAAHAHLAECLLLAGDYDEGFREYAWRAGLGVAPGDGLEAPRWCGAEGAGATLLIVAEQGFGDTLQFCRHAPLAAARGVRVVLAVQPALAGLCATIEGVDAVVAGGEALPAHDAQVPLLDLPRLLGTSVETVPAHVPYLRAPDNAAARGREIVGGPPGLRVGIAWQGNPRGAGDRGRSIPLARFLPLAGIEGVRLVSLQKGAGHEQLARTPGAGGIVDAGSHCRTFADSAGVIEALDLVITSDTAVAHLAGALGRPVWVALKHDADWRWLVERDDSPWYPTMRLFRQRRAGDWAGVFEAIAAALERRAGDG